MVLSMDRWVGKVAIVSGASAGIGAGIVDALVEQGIKVVGVARRVEVVEQRAKTLSNKKGKLYPFKADFSKEADILKTFEWTTKNVGPVSILINNAGVGKEAHLSEASTDVLRTVLDLNVLGLCIATREAVKIMKANNINGHIIHINSLAGHRIPNFPKLNVYPASKHAVTALTETLRQELARMKSKIRVTSISPGLVESEMTTLNKEATPERIAIIKASFDTILKPEDLADAVVYVLSTPEHVQVHELMIRPAGKQF